MFKKSYYLLAMTVCFAGCSVPEPPSVNDSLQQALPKDTSLPDTWDGADASPVVDVDWVESFGDESLNAFVRNVNAHNLDLKAAMSRVKVAASIAKIVGADLKPKVSLGGSVTHAGVFDDSTTSDISEASVGASWELDVWGRVRADIAAAKMGYEASEADYEFARLSVTAQAVKSWFLSVESYQQLVYAKEVVGVFTETRDVVQKKFEAGKLSKKELYLAESDLNGAESRVRVAQIAYEQSIRALEVLQGRYPSNEMLASHAYAKMPDSIPAGIPSELLERRPDLVSANRMVNMAFHRITVAKAARLPRFTLTAAAGATSSDLIEALTGDREYWNVGGNFLAPIFEGGALKEQVVLRTSEQEEALALYGQKALLAFREVEDALSAEVLLSEQEFYLNATLEANQEALTIAQTQFDTGKLDLLSVLQMQARVIDSKVSLIAVKNVRLSQRVDLHLSLGGSF